MEVEEEEIEILEHDIKRSMINNEFMIMHGNDPSGYLPPLPERQRPHTSLGSAWQCGDPALRQLSCISRKGLRSPLPGHRSSTPLFAPESGRPQTSFTSHIQGVLNRRFSADIKRPQTSMGKLETHPFLKSAPEEDMAKLIVPKPLKADHDLLSIEDIVETLSITSSVAGLRRPRFRSTAKKNKRKKEEKKTKRNITTADARRVEQSNNVLTGEWSCLPAEAPSGVRFYLCAHGDDHELERQALFNNAFPQLQEFCHQLNLDFEVVDLRWRAGRHVDTALQETELHRREIQNCRNASVGPFFVLLLGDKYGNGCAPLRIQENEFQVLRSAAEQHKVNNRNIFDDWYLLDENAQPPVFVLQVKPRLQRRNSRCVQEAQLYAAEDKDILHQQYERIRTVLVESCQHAINMGKLTQSAKEKYTKSVFEDEIVEGLLEDEESRTRSLLYIRELVDIPRRAKSNLTDKYTDTRKVDGKWTPNENAKLHLDELKSSILNACGDKNVRQYKMKVKECFLPSNQYDTQTKDQRPESAETAETLRYIDQFTKDFVNDMKSQIEKDKEQWDANMGMKHSQIFSEVLHHATRCQRAAKDFVGREDLLNTVKQRLLGETERRPLVLSGEPGTGKTYLISAIATKCKEWLGKSSVVTARYLGTTTHSFDLPSLLVQVVSHLCVVYNLNPPDEATRQSSNRMVKVFQTILEQISKWHGEKRPLVLLFDGLDLLANTDRAHTMFWLPSVCPKNIYIVLTTDSQKHGILRRLKTRFPTSYNFLDVTKPDLDTLEKLLEREQKETKRTLQPEQIEVFTNSCLKNPNALYVTNLVREAMNWKSYTTVSEDMLPATLEEAVWYNLQKLEGKHGSSLVQHALCYLAVSLRGLSEGELIDVLSCDNIVMGEILYKSEPLTKDSISMPSTFLYPLLLDLSSLITECHIDNKKVFCWKHSILKDIVSKKYFGVENPLSWECRAEAAPFLKVLAKVFLQETGIQETFKHPRTKDKHENANRHVRPQPLRPSNRRKLLLSTRYLAHAMVNDNDLEQLKKNCFGSFYWLLTSLQGLSAEDTLNDFFLIRNRDPDICLVQDFLSLTVNGLKRDPLGLGAQLLGTISNISPRKHPMFVGLLREAMHWLEINTAPILMPLLPCLPSVGDHCKKKIWGLADIMQVERSGHLGVMKNKDGFIEIWDLEKSELAFTLGVQFDKVTPNVFTTDLLVLTLDGYSVTIWEIESGRSIRNIDLSSHIENNSTSHNIMAYTTDFKLISVLSSDEEFNQIIRIIDTESDSIVRKLTPFDVKDEFFGARSSVFLQNKPYMVFANARSETMPNDTQADIVKLNCFDFSSGEYVYRTNCGKKTFSSLLIKDEEKAYINWQSGGFDSFDVTTGVFIQRIKAPVEDHVVCEAQFVSDNHIAIMTATKEEMARNLQSILWLWNLGEKGVRKLAQQDYLSEDEAVRNFLLSNDLTFAVLSAPNISRLYVWNLVTSMCVQSIEAHSDNIDSLFQTSDPFRFCSSSSGEIVVKWWDIYDLVPHGPDDINEAEGNEATVAPLALSKSRRSISAPSILRKQIARLNLDGQASGKSVRFADEEDDDTESHAETDVVAVKKRANASSKENEHNEHLHPSEDPKYDRPNMDVSLHYSLNVTSLCYSKDGRYMVTGSEEMQPVVWEASTAKIIKKMPTHNDEHVGTPVVQYGCHDQLIVGLSTNDFTKNTYPYFYMFQIWDSKSGKAKALEKECLATTFVLTNNTEQAMLTFMQNFDATGQAMSDLVFKMINLKEATILYELSCKTNCIPTEVQITEDNKFAVTNNVLRPEQGSLGLYSFVLDGTDGQPAPRPYEYQKGTKYTSYRPTANILLKNGLSISVGLNGDLQMWDVETNEYEGNLYQDPNIADCMDPGLHNHSGKRINHTVLSKDERYLMCGSQDHTASLWDLQTEVQLGTYKWHKDEVCRVAISPDNQLVATASKDLELAIWNFGVTEGPICHLFIHVAPTVLRISADNQTVAAIGSRKNEMPRMMLFKLKNA